VKVPLITEILVSYPWLFWLAVCLILRLYPAFVLSPGHGSGKRKLVFVNKLPLISDRTLVIAAVFGILLRGLYACGYHYESQIFMEVLVPLFASLPYLRRTVVSIRMMLLCLFPIMALTIVEQLWCTRFGQWHYLLTNGNDYLLWARQNGKLWEQMLYFGGIDYPAIELIFYPAYIIGTFVIAAVAIEILPRSWRTLKPAYAWFFPSVYGPTAAIMFVLSVWFMVSRHTIPFHALAAFMSLLITWLMYGFSIEVRKLTRTKLFVIGTLFSIIQTAIFEFYHAGIGCHWVYIPQNEIASLSKYLYWSFPQIGGAAPNSWPIEEWCAYPTLFVFVTLLLLFFHTTLKIPVMRHTVVIDENDDT
jgi:hypothetical protein